MLFDLCWTSVQLRYLFRLRRRRVRKYVKENLQTLGPPTEKSYARPQVHCFGARPWQPPERPRPPTVHLEIKDTSTELSMIERGTEERTLQATRNQDRNCPRRQHVGNSFHPQDQKRHWQKENKICRSYKE